MDIAAPALRTRCCGGVRPDRGENHDPDTATDQAKRLRTVPASRNWHWEIGRMQGRARLRGCRERIALLAAGLSAYSMAGPLARMAQASHAPPRPSHARPKSLPLARGDAAKAGRDEEQALAFSRTKNMVWLLLRSGISEIAKKELAEERAIRERPPEFKEKVVRKLRRFECGHVSGLFVRPLMTAGPDGFRGRHPGQFCGM